MIALWPLLALATPRHDGLFQGVYLEAGARFGVARVDRVRPAMAPMAGARLAFGRRVTVSPGVEVAPLYGFRCPPSFCFHRNLAGTVSVLYDADLAHLGGHLQLARSVALGPMAVVPVVDSEAGLILTAWRAGLSRWPGDLSLEAALGWSP